MNSYCSKLAKRRRRGQEQRQGQGQGQKGTWGQPYGGVESRSYYSTLFFRLLDTAIINAFILCSEVFKGSNVRHLGNHRWFRIRLAWNLVLEGARMLNPQWVEAFSAQANPSPSGARCSGVRPLGNNNFSRKAGYMSKTWEPTPLRHAPGSHNAIQRLSSRSNKFCVFCRYLWQKKTDLMWRRLLSGPHQGEGYLFQGLLLVVLFIECHCVRSFVTRNFIRGVIKVLPTGWVEKLVSPRRVPIGWASWNPRATFFKVANWLDKD